jgi:hypothetical protein
MGPRAALDPVEKRKILPLPRIEPGPIALLNNPPPDVQSVWRACVSPNSALDLGAGIRVPDVLGSRHVTSGCVPRAASDSV